MSSCDQGWQDLEESGWRPRTSETWTATVAALPPRTPVTGMVVATLPFGCFIRIDGFPDAMGLAEIVGMPRDFELPAKGTHLRFEVAGHRDHNHQVALYFLTHPRVQGAEG